jgi:nucleotide-binding universal stress UspA family protein
MHPTRILHPTDYSEASRPALNTAADLAHRCRASLVLLHVVETLGPEHLSYGELTNHPQPETYRRQLWEEFHRFCPPDPDLRVEYVLSEEEVITAIVRTTVELKCDLIVVSTHGDSGWKRWPWGSIAESVVRRAPCSVLVVKAASGGERLPAFPTSELHPGHLIEKEE